MKCRAATAGALLLLAASAFAAPNGVTMQVTQELKLGDLATKTEARQFFQPPQSFRLEGTVTMAALGITSAMTVVSDGSQVKQLVQTPFGPQATVVDLARVQGALPGYTPSSDYNPLAYKTLIESLPDKKALAPETLDGAPADGYEFSAKGIKAPLPSTVLLGAAEPDKVRVWINPKDGIPRKMEVTDGTGAVILAMLYRDVKTGVEIPPETFRLDFPDGVTPTDVTEMLLKQAANPSPPQAPPR